MKCVVLYVLVTLVICLQAAAAVLIAEKAGIMTAAEEGDCDLVLLHLIADPTSANQSNDEYDTQPHTYAHETCFVCIILILLFSVEALRCIGIVKKAAWSFASFSLKREQT
jgi:hypothetical protein